jgi:hypothetical protein
MADFPDSIFTQRELLNINGQTFDAQKKTTIFAEDLQALAAEIIAIQNVLGTNMTKQMPVGSVYINATDGSNPAILLGYGVWAEYGRGRFLLGVDEFDDDLDVEGETGGSKTVTLTEPQLPNVSGSWTIHGQEGGTNWYNKSGKATGTIKSGYKAPPGTTSGATSLQTPGFAFGNNQAHENMPPWITAYFWKRTE